MPLVAAVCYDCGPSLFDGIFNSQLWITIIIATQQLPTTFIVTKYLFLNDLPV